MQRYSQFVFDSVQYYPAMLLQVRRLSQVRRLIARKVTSDGPMP